MAILFLNVYLEELEWNLNREGLTVGLRVIYCSFSIEYDV